MNSLLVRVEAFSWYLDIITNNDWEILVLGDYKAVMPLPYKRVKRKFFKRVITQPPFCQQLGVFSKLDISAETFLQFEVTFFKLSPFTYQFNAFNSIYLRDNKQVYKRVNYELNLQKPHKEILLKYSKNLKRNLKKATKNELKINTIFSIENFIILKKKHAKHKIKATQYNVMATLMHTLESKNLGVFYTVKKENKVIASAFFIQTESRIVHLFSVSTLLGKEAAAIPFLFNHIIAQNATKNCIFDFEGSMLPGVSKFFKSFGPINKPYYTVLNKKL